MSFDVSQIDHVVVNCSDVRATVAWYTRVLGMREEIFGPDSRVALRFGDQKLNLRPTGAPGWDTGFVDAPGALDLCFLTPADPDAIVAHLHACGVDITNGPVSKIGAQGAMTSVYCRDPDGNLIEIAHYPKPLPTQVSG